MKVVAGHGRIVAYRSVYVRCQFWASSIDRKWVLDVTRLRFLDAVARHGSMTAATRELAYSQPLVSHHLSRLEAETGAQLLQKTGRGIRLTQAGQLLADARRRSSAASTQPTPSCPPTSV